MKNVIAILLVFNLLACQAQNGSTRVDADGFEKGLAAHDVQLLDVRTATEYGNGHIKNSLQADWNNKAQFYDRLQYVDKNKPVYIYCLAGGRSAAAATWMRENGYTQVIELSGGFNAWKSAGKPVEGHSDTKQMTIEEYNASIPADKTVLVDFGATWCPPCVKMQPVLEELEKDSQLHFILIKVDAGVHTDVMNALHVGPIPVFIVYKNGKESWRHEGVVAKEELVAQLK